MSVAEALSRVETGVLTAPCMVCHRKLPLEPARYAELSEPLPLALRRALCAAGVRRFYRHQAEAIDAVRKGDDAVVVTPTASGKTLCYQVPIVESLLARPDARALLLYPTKALAHDQMESLQGLIDSTGLKAPVLAYDGDTPAAERARVRSKARVLVTNPDMLHVGILPHHPQWRDFFERIEYIVVDEMHAYRGVFGSHVANVLRRLLRIARFYGRRPRMVFASATIANPVALANRLSERWPCLVQESGAPTGAKHVVLYNPPLLDRRLGIRRSAMTDARLLANLMQEVGLQTAVFCSSRGAVEELLRALRVDAIGQGRDPSAIRGYRSGYLPVERREIERGLRDGTVRCVVATSALELGVDIGGMAACVLVGYPGSIASTWQRMGRAGRGSEDSLAVLVATASPLDQYIMARPDYVFRQAPERALINPDNLHLLLDHVNSACYELPFLQDEAYGKEDVQEILAFLEGQGQVRRSRLRWHYIVNDYPASGISLRSASPDRVTILAASEAGEEVIGLMDRGTAPVYLHDDAIYMHQGQQYLVEELDWDAGLARVRPVTVDYATRASGNSRMEVLASKGHLCRGGFDLYHGDVAITRQVTSYRRLRLDTLETVGWGQLTLPEQVLETTAMWLTLSDALLNELTERGEWMGERQFARGPNWEVQRLRALERDGRTCRWCGAADMPGRPLQVHHIEPYSRFGDRGGEPDWRLANALDNLITLCPACHRLAEQSVAVRGSLAGLGYVVRHLLPTLLLCDAEDVGVVTESRAAQTGSATLYIYDDLPGGVGLSEQAMQQFDTLIDHALAVIEHCGCLSGCPSCIGPVLQEDSRAKKRVMALARRLQRSDRDSSGETSTHLEPQL